MKRYFAACFVIIFAGCGGDQSADLVQNNSGVQRPPVAPPPPVAPNRAEPKEQQGTERPQPVPGAPWSSPEAVADEDELSPDGTSLTLRPSTAEVEMKRYLLTGYSAPPFVGKGLDDEPIR